MKTFILGSRPLDPARPSDIPNKTYKDLETKTGSRVQRDMVQMAQGKNFNAVEKDSIISTPGIRALNDLGPEDDGTIFNALWNAYRMRRGVTRVFLVRDERLFDDYFRGQNTSMKTRQGLPDAVLKDASKFLEEQFVRNILRPGIVGIEIDGKGNLKVYEALKHYDHREFEMKLSDIPEDQRKAIIAELKERATSSPPSAHPADPPSEDTKATKGSKKEGAKPSSSPSPSPSPSSSSPSVSPAEFIPPETVAVKTAPALLLRSMSY